MSTAITGYPTTTTTTMCAAYLHVIVDALTSLLAIIALLAGKYFGAGWLDPSMGILRPTGRAMVIVYDRGA